MKYDILWKNRGLKTLLAGETILKLGQGLRGIAIPWLVLELTGSPLQLGIAFAVSMSPDIVVAPLSGYFIDNLPRKPMVVLSLLAGAALLAVIPFVAVVSELTPIHVYLVLGALSIAHATYHNTREAMLPDLVGDDDLDEANSLFYIVGTTLSIVFLLVGGVLTSLLGPIQTVGIACVAVTVSALVLVLLPRTKHADRIDDSEISIGRFVSEVKEGIDVIRGTVVQDIILFGVGINVATVPFSLLITVIGHDVFGLAIAYAALLGGFQAGKALGNYGVNYVPWSRERKYVTGIGAVGAAALVVSLGGIVFAPLSEAMYLVVLLVLLAGLGALEPLFNVPSDSLVQIASEENRGIVVAITNAALQIVFPFALLFSGWLVEHVSPFVVFGLSGAILLPLSIVGVYRFNLGVGTGQSRQLSPD